MSSAGDKARAEARKKEAAALAKPMFGFFSSPGAKLEEAHDLYTSAGNAYKIDRQMKESGDCFCKAAEMAIKNNEKDDAANDYWTAAKAYKKEFPALAVAALQEAIKIYKEKGKFRQAADRTKEVAQIWQTSGGEEENALASFREAGDLYSGEDAVATANTCYKEAADLAGALGRYGDATELFELVATEALKSPMTRYGVKELYLKAGICWLATQDTVTTRRKLSEYATNDNTFPPSREYKFLEAIVDAYEAAEQDHFVGAVAEYDRMTKLDPWKTGILLNIKNSIADEPGLT